MVVDKASIHFTAQRGKILYSVRFSAFPGMDFRFSEHSNVCLYRCQFTVKCSYLDFGCEYSCFFCLVSGYRRNIFVFTYLGEKVTFAVRMQDS